jgi:hypothetical protein
MALAIPLFSFLLGNSVLLLSSTGCQMNSMPPTKANAAQIMRTLSGCVSPMVDLLAVKTLIIGVNAKAGKQIICCACAEFGNFASMGGRKKLFCFSNDAIKEFW